MFHDGRWISCLSYQRPFTRLSQQESGKDDKCSFYHYWRSLLIIKSITMVSSEQRVDFTRKKGRLSDILEMHFPFSIADYYHWSVSLDRQEEEKRMPWIIHERLTLEQRSSWITCFDTFPIKKDRASHRQWFTYAFSLFDLTLDRDDRH